MRTLYLLRHAKAVTDDPDGDRARPLAERGERDVRKLAGWMAQHRLAPQLVLCSSAIRTQQTALLLLPGLSPPPSVEYEDTLYLAEPRALLARLRRVSAAIASVLLIGHNPGLHELGVILADPDATGPLPALARGLATAALASFELSGSWAALDTAGARLVAFTAPKDIAGERD